MKKRIFATLALGAALFLGGQALDTKAASAEDVWVYYRDRGAKSYHVYVDDESYYAQKGKSSTIGWVRVTLVKDDGQVVKRKWNYTADEGCFWCGVEGSKGSRVCLAKYSDNYANRSIKIANRPDMVAAYRWLMEQAGREPRF